MSVSTISSGAGYESDVVLRDGSTLHLRGIAPADAPAVLELYERLSPESLYNRFAGMSRPHAEDIQRLCAADGSGDFVLVGERGDRIVAVVQDRRSASAPDTAEVALTVADDFHGLGVATRMLEEIAAIGRSHGLTVFEAFVLGGNRDMLRVFTDSGFALQSDLAHNVALVTLSLAGNPLLEDRAAARARQAASASMRAFFEPRTVAVVGVSRERGRIGSEIFHNIWAAGFRGRRFAVNPCAQVIDSEPSYRSVRDIPGDLDLAVIAVPADQVEQVVDDCIAKQVRAIVVISAGFSETGVDGRAREAAILEKVRAAGIRMIGPNCMGLLNTAPEVGLNATFAPVFPPAGRVAFSSQSGALGLAILDYVRHLNLGISTFVSVGNKADVSSNDLIQYWADDPHTDVILLYLESFGNPRKFSQIARRVGRTKPIVAVKAGRSGAGARAASSHTGALAASDTIVDALFRQCGVIRTDTLDELFDVAMLLANQPIPAGRRVGILTNAGGPGILAADTCEALGLQLPTLSPETVAALRGFLPAAASVTNPIDMLATASADDYRKAISLLLADPGVDSLMVIFIPPLVTNANDVADAIVEGVRGSSKPVLATFLRAQGAPPSLAPVPCFQFPESAARALAHTVEYGRWRRAPVGRVPRFDNLRPDDARRAIDGALAAGRGWLDTDDASTVLRAFGIPVAETRVARSEEEAADRARELGFPVVIKGAGQTLLHKTEAGAVALDLRDEAAVRAAYRDLTSRLGPALEHVLVQPMVREGIEILVGATMDPTFGHVVLCGSGGTLVELMGDTVCRVHPLTDVDAADMLDRMRGVRLLRGFRGAPRADETALREMLLRVSAMLEVCPEIQEMDINPLLVLEKGVCAVDVRIRVGTEAAHQPSRHVAY